MASLSPLSPTSPTTDFLDTPSPTDELEYFEGEQDEPNEAWKAHTKELIAETYQPMIIEAKSRLEQMAQSIRGMDTEKEVYAHYVSEFQECMAVLKSLAKEELECAIKRERLHRRIRRSLPVPMMELDLMDEGNAELINHVDLDHHGQDTFQSLIELDFTPSALLEPEPEPESPQEERGEADPQALVIDIRRIPPEERVWTSASNAAKQHQERIKQQKAALKAEAAGPPPPPPKRWVSASEAASRYQW